MKLQLGGCQSSNDRKLLLASSTIGCGSAIFSELGWTAIGGRLRLTKRELEIVRGVFDDHTELAIADNLGISPHTVHTHAERLRRKLAVVDRAALILKVVQEFLKLSAAPDSKLPPICGKRSAGLCRLRG